MTTLASTISGALDLINGDTAPTPDTAGSGRYLLYPRNGMWCYSADGGAEQVLGGVSGVAAANPSIVIGGTAANPTFKTGTLDVLAAQGPPIASVGMNANKITNLANGSASSDAAAFGQIPTTLPPSGSAGGSLTGSYPNPTIGTAQVTNAMLAAVAANTVKGSVAGGTPADLSQAQLTALVNLATTTLPGALAAADFQHIPSGWIDVTRQGANSMSGANTQAANATAITNIMAAAPSGSVLYFPPGWLPTNKFTIPAKVFIFQGSGSGLNGSLSALVSSTDQAGDWISQSSADYYMQFRDLGFIAETSQSAGSVVNVGGNANNQFQNCVFTGLSSGSTLFNCINFSGTNGGEESIVVACTFTNFTGTAIICNSNLETIIIDGITINGGLSSTTGAACGINVILGGAVQITACDIIGCVNNLLINPTSGTVVASVWAVNTYFDNAFGSCIKITGAGATVRTKFTNCSFTVSANASPANAVEVSSTYAYGSAGMGLDFVSCNVLNTFGSLGVGTGFNITGAGDFIISNCNVAGWAVGVDVTPSSANNTTKPLITGNRIGAAGGYGGNTIGVRFNAGSFTYGSNLLTSNDLTGNTTPLVDNSTYTNGAGRVFAMNAGLATAPPNQGAQTILPATTYTRAGNAVSCPANTLRVGTVIRIVCYYTQTTTASAVTPKILYGANNTNADGLVLQGVAPTATGVAGGARLVAEFVVISATQCVASLALFNNAATGAASQPLTSAVTTAPVTISTTVASYLGLYLSTSTASVVTPQATYYEISSQ